MKITPFRKFRNRRNERKRYKRRLARLEKCGDFQVTQIDGVKVARGKSLNLGHIFEGDGILIVEEIFKNDEYNFDISDRAVVIDIGMNIGLASLYFAARDDVEDVYGFEPFKPTFEQAIFNFKINDKYGGKIHPHNYGLGDRDKELTCEYYSKAPGRMSTVQSIDKIRHSSKYATQMETVQIKDAAEELRPIIERHKEKTIIVKCDTEGAEKEIFESLNSNGILKDIDMVLLEYHFSYDVPLGDMLRKNGFAFFKHRTVTLETGDFGIIRAVRR